MVEFKILESEEMKFGKNNYIEVAKKKSISESGEYEFILITRGYYNPTGNWIFKSSVTVPAKGEIKNFIAQKLQEF